MAKESGTVLLGKIPLVMKVGEATEQERPVRIKDSPRQI